LVLEVDRFDTRTREWAADNTVAAMPQTRYDCTAVPIIGSGRIHVFGGIPRIGSESFQPDCRVMEYNISTNTWRYLSWKLQRCPYPNVMAWFDGVSLYITSRFPHDPEEQQQRSNDGIKEPIEIITFASLDNLDIAHSTVLNDTKHDVINDLLDELDLSFDMAKLQV
jgi:hypothetical protein